jgi:hypothetical protein
LGLKLVMNCPNLRRLPTRTRVRAQRGPSRALLLRATVSIPRRRARGRLLGTVAFKVGRRRVGTAVPDPRTGRVQLNSPLRIRRGVVTATFSGNAALAGSTGRARLR